MDKLRIISKSCKRLYSSIDSRETSKFAILTARDWWDTHGVQKGLHAMNAIRIPLVKSALVKDKTPHQTTAGQPPLHGYSILDVGCGGGILSEPLARLGAQVTGIDVVESNIAIAKEHASIDSSLPEHLLSYRCCTLEELVTVASRDPGPGVASAPAAGSGGGDVQFDCVVASEVIEHVANVKDFTHHLCQAVKPGGSLIMTTINRTFLSYALAIGVAEYVLNLLPRGTHEWNKFVTPDEYSSLLRKNRFRVVESSGMSYNPLTVKWSLTSNMSINYYVVAEKSD